MHLLSGPTFVSWLPHAGIDASSSLMPRQPLRSGDWHVTMGACSVFPSTASGVLSLQEVRMAELQFGAFSARLTRGLFPRQLQRYLGKKASKRLEPKDWKMEPPAVCREGAAGVLVKS